VLRRLTSAEVAAVGFAHQPCQLTHRVRQPPAGAWHGFGAQLPEWRCGAFELHSRGAARRSGRSGLERRHRESGCPHRPEPASSGSCAENGRPHCQRSARTRATHPSWPETASSMRCSWPSPISDLGRLGQGSVLLRDRLVNVTDQGDHRGLVVSCASIWSTSCSGRAGPQPARALDSVRCAGRRCPDRSLQRRTGK
jgi:hypothetical protein